MTISTTDTDLGSYTNKVQDVVNAAPASSAALTRTLREDATFRMYFLNLSWIAYWLVYFMLVVMYGLQYVLGTLQSPAFTAFVLLFFLLLPSVMDTLAVHSFRTFLSLLRMFSRGNAIYNYTPDEIRTA